jgi:hypothetical protein
MRFRGRGKVHIIYRGSSEMEDGIDMSCYAVDVMVLVLFSGNLVFSRRLKITKRKPSCLKLRPLQWYYLSPQ